MPSKRRSPVRQEQDCPAEATEFDLNGKPRENLNLSFLLRSHATVSWRLRLSVGLGTSRPQISVVVRNYIQCWPCGTECMPGVFGHIWPFYFCNTRILYSAPPSVGPWVQGEDMDWKDRKVWIQAGMVAEEREKVLAHNTTFWEYETMNWRREERPLVLSRNSKLIWPNNHSSQYLPNYPTVDTSVMYTWNISFTTVLQSVSILYSGGWHITNCDNASETRT